MKLLIIGGKGTIGKKVSAHFSRTHEIIIAGRTSGDVTVDIADSKSIKAMFESIGIIDAIEKYETYFPGHNPIPMKKVINGYVKSVEGKGTAEIIRMYDNC